MEEEKLKLGDVVKLKSDSPPMTVASIDNYGYVQCIYFYNGEIKWSASSPPTSYQKV